MASFVEMFKMPMRAIEKQFTRSEITLIAWRSQEQSMHMKKRMKSATKEPPKRDPTVARPVDAIIPEGLPEDFYNEEHEVDISKVDSGSALKYFKSFGIEIPVIQPGSPHRPPKEVK